MCIIFQVEAWVICSLEDIARSPDYYYSGMLDKCILPEYNLIWLYCYQILTTRLACCWNSGHSQQLLEIPDNHRYQFDVFRGWIKVVLYTMLFIRLVNLNVPNILLQSSNRRAYYHHIKWEWSRSQPDTNLDRKRMLGSIPNNANIVLKSKIMRISFVLIFFPERKNLIDLIWKV